MPWSDLLLLMVLGTLVSGMQHVLMSVVMETHLIVQLGGYEQIHEVLMAYQTHLLLSSKPQLLPGPKPRPHPQT